MLIVIISLFYSDNRCHNFCYGLQKSISLETICFTIVLRVKYTVQFGFIKEYLFLNDYLQKGMVQKYFVFSGSILIQILINQLFFIYKY